MSSKKKQFRKPAHVSVKIGGKVRTNEQLIRKFIKKCKEEKVVETYKRRTTYHRTRRQRARDKKAAAKLRWQRKMRNKG